jgi:hypothetical protein
MHEAAVADRRQQKRKRKLETKDRRAQAAIRERDCMTRPKGDVVKYPAILAERDLALSATIEIIEH